MAETTNYQCPSCGGRLRWNGEIGKLQCEFCESEFTAEEVEALYAQRQAKADAKAAGDREARVGQDATGDERLLEAMQNRARAETLTKTYEEAIAQGMSPDEAVDAANRAAEAAAAAVVAGAQGPAAQAAPVSAAQASTSEATRVQPKHASTGDPIQDYLANAKWTDADADSMRAYNCPSCGAQLMVDQVTAVTSCPYCGNNTVVPGQLSDVLKPDYVIPFKYDKNDAIVALKNYYQGKVLLPDAFTDQNHIEEIQGVYVPFWLYSGTGEGEVVMNGRNIRTWTDSKNQYTETDHYVLTRAGSMQFRHVPVDGSTKMPDAHMDAIEPFDYSELVPFSVAYLPGYLTDRYDQDAKVCEQRATSRVDNTVEAELQATASGYMEIDVASTDSQLKVEQVAYALLPVWMLHTKWNGQDYLFAMNGQTGKLIGDLPVDNGKLVKRFLLFSIPLIILIAAAIIFLFGGYSM